MGDIGFTIAKDVNLNKLVNLEINKTVNVNVDNPDQLATAEADAEAFGFFGLAETDAFTVVTPDTAFAYSESSSALDLDNGHGCDIVGGVDLDGFTDAFYDGSAAAGGPPPAVLTIPLASGDAVLNNIIGAGDLEPLFPPIPGGQPPLTILPGLDLPWIDGPTGEAVDIDDLVLINPEEIILPDPPAGFREFEYTLDGPWEVSFGQRTIDVCETPEDATDDLTGELILTVPDETAFLVEFIDDTTNNTAIAEVEFEAFPDGQTAVFSIGAQPIANANLALTADSNVDFDSGIEFADWEFNSIITDSLI